MKNMQMICSLTVCLFLTGCWDMVELENRAFISAIAIDAYEQDIEGAIRFHAPDADYRFVATVSVPSSGTDTESGTALTATADTFMPALSMIRLGMPQQPYYGQAKVVVLGEGMLSDSELMRQAIDGMERNREISRKIIMLACEGNAAEILKAELAGKPFGMYAANFYADRRAVLGVAFKKDLESVLLDVRHANGTIIPMVAVREGFVELSGAAIVRDFELVSRLDDTEVRGLLLAKGKSENARITTDFDGVRLPLRLASQRAKLNFERTEQGLMCRLEISTKGSIEGYLINSDEDISSAENVARLNELFAHEIANNVTATFARLAETNVDGFGMFDRLRKFNYDLYEEFVQHKQIRLSDIIFVPVVDVRITDVGATR